MSYQVLARKYRPQSFNHMVGQNHVVQALANALRLKRLHHAFLFTGTRGVGKTTVSRILAKALNCIGPDGTGDITHEPCGICPACVAIEGGYFPDYTELDAASHRGVEEVQQLLEQAIYKPVEGRFKVFMIDEVHMLSNTAFNAMLKTLEEPPPYVKFVLATTDPQKVPITVLSRCLQLNLRPMAPDTIAGHLTQVLSQENIDHEAAALTLIAQHAHGSMRDALSLCDQAIAFGEGRIRLSDVRQMLGSVDDAYVFELVEALARYDGAAVVQLCETLRAEGHSAAAALEAMASLLHQLALVQMKAQSTENARLSQLAQALPADEVQLLYSLCLQGKTEIDLAPDEYAGMCMVLLRLLAFKPVSAAATNTATTPAIEKKKLEPLAPLVEAHPEIKPSFSLATAKSPHDHSDIVLSNTQDLSSNAATPSEASTETHPHQSSFDQALQNIPIQPEDAGFMGRLEKGDARREPQRYPAVSRGFATPQLPFLGEPETGIFRLDGYIPVSPEDTDMESESAGMQCKAQTTAIPSGIARICNAAVRQADQSQTGIFRWNGYNSAQTWPSAENDPWFNQVMRLTSQPNFTGLVRELALQSILIEESPSTLILQTESSTLCQDSYRQKLEQVLQTLGESRSVVIKQGPAPHSPARRIEQHKKEAQEKAQTTIANDPWVQSLVQDFGARIVSVDSVSSES